MMDKAPNVPERILRKTAQRKKRSKNYFLVLTLKSKLNKLACFDLSQTFRTYLEDESTLIFVKIEIQYELPL